MRPLSVLTRQARVALDWRASLLIDRGGYYDCCGNHLDATYEMKRGDSSEITHLNIPC